MGRAYVIISALVFVFLFFPFVAATTDHSDVIALEDLYLSLNQPSHLVGWRLGGDPCEDSWEGITCKDSSVTSINLSGLNLSGHLGDQLFQLVSLKQLNVSFNHIAGEIPSSLPPNVTHIDLSFNHFSGHIPFSIMFLQNLHHLSLRNNHLNVRAALLDIQSSKADSGFFIVATSLFSLIVLVLACLLNGGAWDTGLLVTITSAALEFPTQVSMIKESVGSFFRSKQEAHPILIPPDPNPGRDLQTPNTDKVQNTVPQTPPKRHLWFIVLVTVGSLVLGLLCGRRKNNKDSKTYGVEGSVTIPSFSNQEPPLFHMKAFYNCRKNTEDLSLLSKQMLNSLGSYFGKLLGKYL